MNAEKFNFLGISEGFRSYESFKFPLERMKIDVSGFDYWTTFAGYNKNDSATPPTKKQINESEQLAVNLYYDLKSVKCIVGYESDIINNPVEVIQDVFIYPQAGFNYDQQIAGYYPPTENQNITGFDYRVREPKERAEGGTNFRGSFSTFTSSANSTQRAFYNLCDAANQSGFDNGIFFFRGGSIVRFYNGSTTDEENYIGLGCGQTEFASSVSNKLTYPLFDAQCFADIADCRTTLAGYCNDDVPSNYLKDFQYIDFQGISFVVCCNASDGSSIYDGFVDAQNLQAKIEFSFDDAVASISELVFWDYA